MLGLQSHPGQTRYVKEPLIMHLNKQFIKQFPSDAFNVNVCESMIPYTIAITAVRHGVKFWSLNASNGYLISTEPYQGKETALSHSDCQVVEGQRNCKDGIDLLRCWPGTFCPQIFTSYKEPHYSAHSWCCDQVQCRYGWHWSNGP